MKKSLKIFLSFLLIYEPFAYWFLSNRNICRSVFEWDFCGSDVRYLLFMGLPVILMTIYLMWEKQIVSILAKKKDQKKKTIVKTKKTRNRPQQRFIGPFEALGRFIAKAFCVKGTAQRSEYWWIALFYLVIQIAMFYFVYHNPSLSIVSISVTVLFFVPFVNLTARRWNDLGVDGAILAWFVAVLGIASWFSPFLKSVLQLYGLCQIIIFCMPSYFEDNKYRSAQQDSEEGLDIK